MMCPAFFVSSRNYVPGGKDRGRTMKNGLVRRLCLTGILALVFYLLHDWVGALYYPGYDRLSQAVSDLTAVSAPSAAVAGGLSQVYGLFSCLCGTLVCIVAYESRAGNRLFRLGVYLFGIMLWISAVGYALFPLSEAGYAGTLQDVLHTYVITSLVVALSIVSLVMIATGGFRYGGKLKIPAVLAAAALLCMFAGAVGVSVVPPAYFGVMERFSTYSAVVFTAVLGIYGYLGFFGGAAQAAQTRSTGNT